MAEKVLNCSKCSHRFSFEHQGELPDKFVCPQCHHEGGKAEFSALVICNKCRAKLSLPLDIIYDRDNICPRCGQELDPETLFSGEKLGSTFDGNGEDQHRMYKRLLQDGDFFDKYRVIRMLGKGGMAEVYLAEHLLLKRQCALKLMRGNAASDDPVFVKRFLREAKLLNSIEHENIVKVFDVGSDYKSGMLFIAMEFVEGSTLLDIMHDHLLEEDELNTVLITMAGALKALAEAKVVHRDIKPSNIMVTLDGTFKLMDLGIAKSTDSEGEMTLTMEQAAIGTPNYASPEQCRSAHNVDIRSDIYCLGATLYHLASGKLPFEGDTPVATILNVMQNEPEPLRNLRPDLSAAMIALIERMMKKNPDERPADPDELLACIYGRSNRWLIVRALLKKAWKKSWPVILQWSKKIWELVKKLFKRKELPLKTRIIRAVRNVIAILVLILVVTNYNRVYHLYEKWRADVEHAAETGGKDAAPGFWGQLGRLVGVLVNPNAAVERSVNLHAEEEKAEENPAETPSAATETAAESVPAAKTPEKAEESAELPLENSGELRELRVYPSGNLRKLLENLSEKSMPLFRRDILPVRGLCAVYDFAREIPLNSNFDYDNIHDGALWLKGEKAVAAVADPSSGKRLETLEKNAICLSDFNMNSSTVSMDFCLDSDGDDTILSLMNVYGWQQLTMGVEEGFLTFALDGRFKIKTAIRLPRKKWVNITFCMDGKEQCFTLFSGQCFGGAWFLPLSRPVFSHGFARFGGRDKLFTGKVARFRAWNSVIDMPRGRPASRVSIPTGFDRPELLVAENGAITGALPWGNPFDAGAWQLKWPQFVAGRPLLVLMVDPLDEKSRAFCRFMAEKPDIRAFIENKFTPVYVPCVAGMGNLGLRRWQLGQEVIGKIGKKPASLPAVAFFDSRRNWIGTEVCREPENFFDQLSAASEKVAANSAAANTVEERLADTESRLKILERQERTPLLESKIEFARRQIEELRKQLEIKDAIRKKRYSAAATKDFHTLLQNYLRECRKHESDRIGSDEFVSWQREKPDRVKELARMLKDDLVDPNVSVEYSYRDPATGQWQNAVTSLINLVFLRRNMHALTPLIPVLKDKLVDVNSCSGDLPLDFYFLGKDRIPVSVVVRMIGENPPRSIKEYCERPKPLSEEFYRILLLAPAIDEEVSKGVSLMHLAASRNDVKMARALLDAGFVGHPGLWSGTKTPFHLALDLGSHEFIEFCKEHKLIEDDISDRHVQYNFIQSIRGKKYPQVKAYLKNGADPQKKWFNGLDALENACFNDDTKMIKTLFENPEFAAKVKERGAYCRSLYIAVYYGYRWVLDALIQNGVMPAAAGGSEFAEFTQWANRRGYYAGSSNAKGRLAAFAVYAALERGKPEDAYTIWHTLVKDNILEKDDNAVNAGLFRLVCTLNGADEVDMQRSLLKFLLKNGADPRYVNVSQIKNYSNRRMVQRAQEDYYKSRQDRDRKRR
ncbi:MAG: protein kinase [Lentisphaeria bacterium]|nr:protein kinase [Lentisphaeria bacterium]